MASRARSSMMKELRSLAKVSPAIAEDRGEQVTTRTRSGRSTTNSMPRPAQDAAAAKAISQGGKAIRSTSASTSTPMRSAIRGQMSTATTATAQPSTATSSRHVRHSPTATTAPSGARWRHVEQIEDSDEARDVSDNQGNDDDEIEANDADDKTDKFGSARQSMNDAMPTARTNVRSSASKRAHEVADSDEERSDRRPAKRQRLTSITPTDPASPVASKSLQLSLYVLQQTYPFPEMPPHGPTKLRPIHDSSNGPAKWCGQNKALQNVFDAADSTGHTSVNGVEQSHVGSNTRSALRICRDFVAALETGSATQHDFVSIVDDLKRMLGPQPISRYGRAAKDLVAHVIPVMTKLLKALLTSYHENIHYRTDELDTLITTMTLIMDLIDAADTLQKHTSTKLKGRAVIQDIRSNMSVALGAFQDEKRSAEQRQRQQATLRKQRKKDNAQALAHEQAVSKAQARYVKHWDGLRYRRQEALIRHYRQHRRAEKYPLEATHAPPLRSKIDKAADLMRYKDWPDEAEQAVEECCIDSPRTQLWSYIVLNLCSDIANSSPPLDAPLAEYTLQEIVAHIITTRDELVEKDNVWANVWDPRLWRNFLEDDDAKGKLRLETRHVEKDALAARSSAIGGANADAIDVDDVDAHGGISDDLRDADDHIEDEVETERAHAHVPIAIGDEDGDDADFPGDDGDDDDDDNDDDDSQ